MNQTTFPLSAIIAALVSAGCFGAAIGHYVGIQSGKADELARWKQLVLPLGIALVKRYDPITGEARTLLITADKTTVLEIKP